MTEAQKWEELRKLWVDLLEKVKTNREAIPEATVSAFGAAMNAFLDALAARKATPELYLTQPEALRSFFENRAMWAGRLAQWVGRSPLPAFEEPAWYQAARAAEHAVDEVVDAAASGLGVVVGIVGGLWLLSRRR